MLAGMRQGTLRLTHVDVVAADRGGDAHGVVVPGWCRSIDTSPVELYASQRAEAAAARESYLL